METALVSPVALLQPQRFSWEGRRQAKGRRGARMREQRWDCCPLKETASPGGFRKERSLDVRPPSS